MILIYSQSFENFLRRPSYVIKWVKLNLACPPQSNGSQYLFAVVRIVSFPDMTLWKSPMLLLAENKRKLEIHTTL